MKIVVTGACGMLGSEVVDIAKKRGIEVVGIDLKSPESFNEKIIWLKLHDNNNLKKICADKYEVRSYINNKIGIEYLTKLYSYDGKEVFEEVNKGLFDSLPNKFIMKCTVGSGNNYICLNKSLISFEDVEHLAEKWKKEKYGVFHYEPQYIDVKPRIIFEEYLCNNDHSPISDWNFYCCNGKVCVVRQFVKSGNSNEWLMYYYDENDELIGTNEFAKDSLEKKLELPSQYKTMKNIAAQLSQDFIFVRVDLYCVREKIYFSELTFTPTAGFGTHFSEKIDKKLGKDLKITEDN